MASIPSLLDSLAPPTGSFRIRAPVTADDDSSSSDIEYNSEKVRNFSRRTGKSSSSSTVDDGSEYEEFESGEDDFETASETERHFVGEPDGESQQGSGFVEKDENFRPLVCNPDEESLDNLVVEEEESALTEVYGLVVGLGEESKQLRPIAQLSMDDDEFDELVDDEGVVSEVEDSRFMGLVKVPSFGVLERVDIPPRVKILGVEDDEEVEEDEVSVQEDASAVNSSKLSSVSKINDSLVSGDPSRPENGVSGSMDYEFGMNGSVSEPFSVEMAEDLVKPSVLYIKDVKDIEFGMNGSVSESFSVEMAEDLVKPSVAYTKNVMMDTGELNEDVKHAIEDSSPSAFNGHEIHATIWEAHVDSLGESESVAEENAKLAVDEIVETCGPQHQECMVEVEGEKAGEPTDCHSSEVESAVGASLSQKNGEGEKLDGGCLLTGFLDNTILRNEIQSINNVGDGDLGEVDILDDEPTSFCVGDEAHDWREKTEEPQQNSLLSDKDIEDLIFGVSETVQHFTTKIGGMSAASSLPEAESFADHEPNTNRQITGNMDELVDNNKEHEDKELFDSAIAKALLKAAVGAQATKPVPTSLKVEDVVKDNLSEEDKEMISKIQHIRVKFLRVVQRLGLSTDDSVVAQVLRRLVLAAGVHAGQEFSLESAQSMTRELKAEGKDDLDFSLNVLVLGKTGVGKSATVNSIFQEKKVIINAFEPGTRSVKEITGTVNGIKIRVLDTPGLRSPVKEEGINRKILASINKFVKKFPPDVVLYVDRLDSQARDPIDLPLLRSVTNQLTVSIWQNAIITLTHAASPLPDGPTESPQRFELVVAQRSHVIQQAISRAVGDLHLMNPSMMHPVSLVENHASSPKNENGEILLPNGQNWRPQLLLLCSSLKILSEASSILKPRDPHGQKKLFGFQPCSLSLPHLVSSLLQYHPHLKLTADQGGDDIDSDVELIDLSDSDEESEDDYEQLPPFKPLRKSQVEKLSKEQRKAYFEEYDYRMKLVERKQWKEEVKRLKEIKKRCKDNRNGSGYIAEDEVQEDGGPVTVPVPMPDFVLPPSFDGDDPSYKYRSLEPTSQLLVRPVHGSQGWDHNCGYDGVSIERNFAIAGRFPGAFAIQITKDKKESNIHLNSSICAKHGGNGSTMAGFDIQTVGRQLAYILRSETKFKNFKMNKTSTGISITLLGENIATGLKIEDQIVLGKRLVLVGSGGAVRTGGDTAFGGNFEVRLRSKDFPTEQDQSTLGLSLINWRGDLGAMASLQTQLLVGQRSKMAIRIGMNGRQSGQITFKTSCSDLHIAIISMVPVLLSVFRSICQGSDSS